MSLLLDALKKAAAQKEKQAEAAKPESGQNTESADIPDETETKLAVIDENTDISKTVDADIDSTSDEDETQIATAGNTEYTGTEAQQYREAVGIQGESEDDTFTALSTSAEKTDISSYDHGSEKYLSDEDETQIVPVDRTEFTTTEAEQFEAPDVDDADDETFTQLAADDEKADISRVGSGSDDKQDDEDETQVVSDDSTEFRPTETARFKSGSVQLEPDEDDTFIELATSEDETVIVQRSSDEVTSTAEPTQFVTDYDDDREDDTQLLPTGDNEADGTDISHIISSSSVPSGEVYDKEGITEAVEENPAIGETVDTTGSPNYEEDQAVTLSNEDVTEFMGLETGNDDTLIKENVSDLPKGKATADDDLTMTLTRGESVDDTSASNATAGADLKISVDGGIDTASLAREDQPKPDAEQTSTITNNAELTITSGIELESLRNEYTIVRQDATSTHTDAPDNYDRTLMLPVNDDVSKIFAGMKSEEDVSMTPDYAKRVFLSKSSANRLHNYKIYTGIMVSILLAIFIFTSFEFQDELNRLDATLMPLKRDPMPGVLSKAGDDNKNNLFEKNCRTRRR